MKTQDHIRKDRIVVSGFSLGTEPMMVLGTLDTSIYAFVYNDFLCQTQERAEVITMPDKNGRRPFPNSIRHLIPDFWNVKVYHYKKFAYPNTRKNVKHLPEGLDRNEYFRMVNVDGPNHYFKSELVVPWLRELLEER